MKNRRTCAIIVAAGKGSRMKSECPKQFIEVKGRPILYYTIKAFENSNVDEIIVVTGEEYISYVREEIVTRYEFQKVSNVIQGGDERYESVYRGLLSMVDCGYVMVHDAARPFVTSAFINEMIEAVWQQDAVIAGVKAKDTVKMIDENGYVESTPNRERVWNIQTPQAFAYDLLKNAYDKVIGDQFTKATDDAMVVEYATKQRIKVMEGSYGNIKITTPEDLKESLFADL